MIFNLTVQCRFFALAITSGCSRKSLLIMFYHLTFCSLYVNKGHNNEIDRCSSLFFTLITLVHGPEVQESLRYEKTSKPLSKENLLRNISHLPNKRGHTGFGPLVLLLLFSSQV